MFVFSALFLCLSSFSPLICYFCPQNMIIFMSTPFFRFKKFTVWHDKCGMKVGTDGVLLGAWCNVSNASKALDIGSGSGLISLMLAQRNAHVHVDAIDIDADAVIQSAENVSRSIFSERITVIQYDITRFGESCCCGGISDKYDLIASNPPFYTENVLSSDKKRNNARHASSLPFCKLLEKASILLADEGEFDVILPFGVAADFISMAAMYGLFLSRRTDVKNSCSKPFKRVLLAFCKKYRNAECGELCLRGLDNHYSEEYKQLTADFYE